MLFKVTAKLNGIADYGALGNYVGKMIGERIPVFDGFQAPSTEELVYFGAALASAGGVAMFHAVGITPEAPDVETAFGGRKYEVIELGEKELEKGYENLNCGKSRQVDLVALGCPHCSLKQVRQIAQLLDGRKVHDGVTLWVHTNAAVKGMAQQLGYAQTIEAAGGVLTQDLCVVLSAPELLGFKTLATHSPKMAFYAPGGNGMDVWYGDEKRCINAAITGIWE